MHDIERYGIGKSELSQWRNAKRATLLFAPRGEMVALTLMADEQVVGRHVVEAAHFTGVLAGYAQIWHAAVPPGAANAAERSFVTAFGIAGQGVEPGLPPHPGPPKGYPPVNYMIHQQLCLFSACENELAPTELGQFTSGMAR